VTVPGIHISIAGPSTVMAGVKANFKATVTNDPTNEGVTWTVSCSSPPCGVVAPSRTTSGEVTTYTAPTTPPVKDLHVSLVARSVSNPSGFAIKRVTVPSVTISLIPGSALIPQNVKQRFTAKVGNDLTHAGVTWTLTQAGSACSPSCGTIDPARTASGITATYTAPSQQPANHAVLLTAIAIADTTKSNSANLIVSAGTVKLVPVKLDFGTERTGQSSPPQATTLTNTGSSALNVHSIASNSSDFLLIKSNPCGTSVAVESTCRISLIFKPTRVGTRVGMLIIRDSSIDSPQMVSLTGKGFRGCSSQIRKTLSDSPVRTALATSGTASVPAPTGASTVGTRVMRLVDSKRADPFLENGTKRELMVRFWYPASLDNACKRAEYTPAPVWSYFSQLMGLPLPAVTTNSCLDARVTEGRHPVVVFSHGYTGTFTDYTFIFEELASYGYVVASVDHTYEATAVQFPDGRFVHSGFGSHLGKTLLEDEASLSFALSVRLDDLKFAVDEVERLDRSDSDPFGGKLDTRRIAVAGHSMGALAASLSVQREPRFKSGLSIDVHDGYVPDAVIETATRTPFLIMASGRQQWTENECALWSHLKGGRFAVNFEGAEHLTSSDAVWLAKYAIKTGTMGPEKSVSAIRAYIVAFLNSHLRGEPLDPLLRGPSPEYPDAAVVTGERALCSKDSIGGNP
jgi:dienelactone hydrolase